MKREQLLPIIQGYIGMTPKDHGCQDWNEMQEKMADDIMSLDILDSPHRDIDDWIFNAHQGNKDYIIVIRDDIHNCEYPLYCDDFQRMHERYHENINIPDISISQIIRVDHDGTAEENLQLHNLI